MTITQFPTLLGASVVAALTSTAALAAANPRDGTFRPGDSANTRLVLAQTNTACVGGYRTIHIVRGQGRTGQGVIVRCRG